VAGIGPVEIRPARDGDAAAIAQLLGELGYPSTAEALPARLEALRSPEYAVRVAVNADGVVGLMSLHRLRGLHMSDPACYITALVTSASSRGQGVGRQLLEEAEAWARATGCNRITLTTALHRHEAHAFYEANGFAHTGKRFVKELPSID
jgi:GNAT superfamily N-acetyltransferase